MVVRDDYVPKELDPPLLVPDQMGLPQLRLALVWDRLVLVSTLVPDALINPKSPHLKGLGLYVSYAHGSSYHERAFDHADHRPGAAVELRREPDNEYSPYSVQMRAPSACEQFGYVQRGKVRAIARLIDDGVDMAGVTLREGFVLLGPRHVLEHLSSSPSRRPRRSFLDRLLGGLAIYRCRQALRMLL